MMYSMTPQDQTSLELPSKKLCISASGAVYASVPSALFGSLFTWRGSQAPRCQAYTPSRTWSAQTSGCPVVLSLATVTHVMTDSIKCRQNLQGHRCRFYVLFASAAERLVHHAPRMHYYREAGDDEPQCSTCSVFEYSKSLIFSTGRVPSEASIRLCSRTSRFFTPSRW